jgi:hypothetical protein
MSTVERGTWHTKDSDKPGPGEYGYETSFKKISVAPKLQNFGSSTVRPFDLPKELQNSPQKFTPGPGQYYNPNDNIITHITSTNSIASVPFGGNAPRFTKTTSTVPPVGHYDSQGENSSFVQDTLKKNKQHGNYGVFGSTSKRFNRDKNTLPGPGSYDVKETNKRMEYKSHMFASSSGRLTAPASPTPPRSSHGQPLTVTHAPSQPTTGVPPVGSYDIKTEWVKKRPATHAVKPFISKSDRFTDIVDMPGSHKELTPGPGDYEHSAFNAVVDHKSFSKADHGGFGGTLRFTSPPKPAQAVGPGSYAVDSAVLNPLLKRSYNVTI